MPHFKKLTPNLLVANVERSLAFYVDMLGFERGMTVPDASPFVFASVTSGPVEIFFNDAATAVKEYPALRRQADRRHRHAVHRSRRRRRAARRLKSTVTIVMPLVTQFYGMREFAIRIRTGT